MRREKVREVGWSLGVLCQKEEASLTDSPNTIRTVENELDPMSL